MGMCGLKGRDTGVATITKCRCDEGVRLEPDRIVALYAELGPTGAEQLISVAMEDMAVALSVLEKAALKGIYSELVDAVDALDPLARQVGMDVLVRVARDLLDCAARCDTVAEAAVLARLVRLGDRCLTAVWDLSDMRV